MRIKLTLLLAFVFLSSLKLEAHNLAAFFSVCTFNSPDKGPFVETYLNVVGNSVKVAEDANGKFQGKVLVELTFTQDGKVKYHDKYNLLGSLLDDSLGTRPDFIDQQRILLPYGEYDLALTISDKLSPGQSFTSHRPVKIYYPKDSVSISDIELVASYSKETEETNFTKSGLYIVPLVSDFYPPVLTTLKFYAEIYNTQTVLKSDAFVINYFISDQDNSYITNNLASFKRDTPQVVNVIMAQLPLADLYSGNYNLTIQVRDKHDALVAIKQVFFQRDNAKPVAQPVDSVQDLDISKSFVSYITSKDTLKAYILCLRPISTPIEADFGDNQLHKVDLKYMQQFFYNFWLKRNASDPQKAWADYLGQVKKVNAIYSTRMIRGYSTDRGRVYLQYGPPTSITREDNEPGAYPYEIWHYYKLDKQSNRKFIFYCREPATNLYTLLHSDATGEVYNERWQSDLYYSNPQSGNNFNQSSPGQYGGKALDEFNNPK